MNIGGPLDADFDADAARIHMQTEASAHGVAIDADAVLTTLASCVGWYRVECEVQSPKEQRGNADRIVTLLTELRELMSLDYMSPDFRALLQENMRTLGVAAPDWAKLQVCATSARDNLRQPKRGERTSTAPKHHAIRRLYESVRASTTPQMGMELADELAATLFSGAAGVPTPTDRDELRKITRGN
ncbi:hypothetical protein H5368_02180 [Luteimonas sp. MC1782]|uniref:hypothetical protein n=1 Tax=Luteimonas sp. MC1782 TaxID=2760305 RepID=UPI0016035AF2|nr:hypothetical protein [Luteimonas sp. MC1782]MBB1471832.1 hypothetical protein [Luteimonas sp. MC1782]